MSRGGSCRLPTRGAKNVGAGDLFYPIPDNSGVALVAVVGADGKTYSPRAKAAKAPDPKERVFCWKAAPGETVYLHPMYSWIDPLRDFDLPPGTYSITVTYENQREGRFSPRAEGSVPISAWKGKLSAPSVTFTVPAPKAPQKPPPPQPAAARAVCESARERDLRQAGPIPSPLSTPRARLSSRPWSGSAWPGLSEDSGG